MKNHKLSVKLLIIIATISTLSLAIFESLMINQAKISLFEEKLNLIEEIVDKSSENLKEQVDGYLSTVVAMATYVGGQEIFNMEKCLPILRLEAESSDFIRIGVINIEGFGITTDNQTGDFSQREYFKSSMQGKAGVSNRLKDYFGGGEINVFSSPIYNLNIDPEKKNPLGVLFATKTLQSFSEKLNTLSFEGKGFFYIIGADGSPITDNKNENSIGKFENFYDAIELYDDQASTYLKDNIQSKKSGNIVYTRDHTQRQLYFAPTAVNDWYLIFSVPVETISFQTNQIILNLTIFSVILVLFAIAFSSAIIQSYQKNYRKLESFAYTDHVTKHYNWAKFQLMAKSILVDHPEKRFAMIVFDIQKFKILNDLYGYEVGNEVLKKIADYLAQIIEDHETFSRTATDNFNLLLKYENSETLIKKLTKLSNDISTLLDNYLIKIFIGINLIEDPTEEIDIISNHANIAKNIAKTSSTNFYAFYDAQKRKELLQVTYIENLMSEALQNEEFEVYLQPKFLVDSEKICGAEALVRWNKKNHGIIYPNDFIPIFEKNGFIAQLDLYMCEKVCDLIIKWKKEYNKELPISINISRANMNNNNLVSSLLEITKRKQVSPKLIEIELTESAVFEDIEKIRNTLLELREAGFLISIDDFGSGYSSLGALKNLPADYVKIDKTFFDGPNLDGREEELVINIVSLIRGLNLFSIAEGVETKKQLSILKAAGCDIVQGYFFSKPIPAHNFEKLYIAK